MNILDKRVGIEKFINNQLIFSGSIHYNLQNQRFILSYENRGSIVKSDVVNLSIVSQQQKTKIILHFSAITVFFVIFNEF